MGLRQRSRANADEVLGSRFACPRMTMSEERQVSGERTMSRTDEVRREFAEIQAELDELGEELDWAEEQLSRLDPELAIVQEMRAFLEKSRERYPKLRERERKLYQEFVETFGPSEMKH
jgi:septal ring factor EnvC (AmiA/AmiB activator)